MSHRPDSAAGAAELSSYLRVILQFGLENLLLGEASGDEPGLLAELDRLGASSRTEFVEQAAGVSLDRILADKQTVGDFAVAQTGGDQTEDLQFAGSDAKFKDALFVGRKRSGVGRGRLRLLSGEGET